MAGIGQVAGDDLRAQLNEYHVLVAEIIGALTADVTQNTNRITRLESQDRYPPIAQLIQQ